MKLLITGAWNCTKEQCKCLEKAGCEIFFLKNENEKLDKKNFDVDIIICNTFFQYHDIEKFPNLKVIQLTSAGYDRIPMEKVKEKNIHVFNACGVYSVPMAEFALCGVLQLYKKSRWFAENQKKHNWIKMREIEELYGKTVTIVGCGNVGKECAIRFSAMGCRVLGVNRHLKDDVCCEKMYELSEIDGVISISDIVILTIALSEETKKLFDNNRISKMKDTAVLVNLARGEIVEEKALIKALNNKKIAGAIIDVFEEEPLEKSNCLWDMPNVIITPHNSFVGENNAERLWNVIKNNIEKIWRNK